jgi:dolichol-phosphate mannosyltransferase
MNLMDYTGRLYLIYELFLKDFVTLDSLLEAKKRSILRFFKFGIVGGSGVVVNVALLHVFTTFGKLDYKLASICAIECAVINNFLWNYFWTWKDRQVESKRSFVYMLLKFHLSSGLTALIVNWGLLVLLTDVLHTKYHLPFITVSDMHISNLIGIACGAVVNFFLGHFWVFKRKPHQPA